MVVVVVVDDDDDDAAAVVVVVVLVVAARARRVITCHCHHRQNVNNQRIESEPDCYYHHPSGRKLPSWFRTAVRVDCERLFGP